MDPLTLPHRLTAAHPPSGKLTERIDISPGKHAQRCFRVPTNSGPGPSPDRACRTQVRMAHIRRA
jgi:hypothetical protein